MSKSTSRTISYLLYIERNMMFLLVFLIFNFLYMLIMNQQSNVLLKCGVVCVGTIFDTHIFFSHCGAQTQIFLTILQLFVLIQSLVLQIQSHFWGQRVSCLQKLCFLSLKIHFQRFFVSLIKNQHQFSIQINTRRLVILVQGE